MLNAICLCGTVSGEPCFSHCVRGDDFYSAEITTVRLSGIKDSTVLMLPGRLLGSCGGLLSGQRIKVEGQVRTYKRPDAIKARLLVTVFVQGIVCWDEDEDINIARLSGTLLLPAKCRQTPLGRSICDMLLLVPRAYGKADAVPIIAWGKTARQCEGLEKGSGICLSGRLQSRQYQKRGPDDSVETKTAYELSVSELELA